MLATAPLNPNAAIETYRQRVGAAVASGELPRGLGLSVTASREMGDIFLTLDVAVTESPVMLICPRSARLDRPRAVLGQGGADMRRTLLRLATAEPGVIGSVNFAKGLVTRQLAFVRGLSAAATVETATTPDGHVAPAAPAANLNAAPGASAIVALSDEISALLAAGTKVLSADLYAMADKAFGGTQAAGAWATKDAYEAAELAMRKAMLSKGDAWAPIGDLSRAVTVAGEIDATAGLLPTQTRRDDEMVDLQQFSTPPAYAWALAWIAGPTAGDLVLEPSAGTGALAVPAFMAGARLHTNEISDRRIACLRNLGFSPTSENAEQIANILAGKVEPTIVLMNPPFSRSVRTGERIDPRIAGAHLQAALSLLQEGGRLVAIVGRSTGAGPRGSWLTAIRQKYALRANVLVSGNVFRSHGTGCETRVLVIDKVKDESTPLMGSVGSVADLLKLLAPVRRSAMPEVREDNRFVAYRPQTLNIHGARRHPNPLVESWAMASVTPPQITYTPHFPASAWTEGAISDAQLESVCLAGQAHGQWLVQDTDGVQWRRGFALGDSMGVGKGRTIAAIIRDSECQGERKALWLTANDVNLLAAARRDYEALGGKPGRVFSLRQTTRTGEAVAVGEGVMLVSYGTLRSARGEKSRVDQIVEWCGGPDFNGVLVIDEGHRNGNGLDQENFRGHTSASQTAMASIELQKCLPRAKVVYSSATQADQARNLAYCVRLGIFGADTAFPTAQSFVNTIDAAGIAAMEVVARDMRAMGLLAARSLSLARVKYERLAHELTLEQTVVYDRLADIWQRVYTDMGEAMKDAGSKSDGRATAAARSAFYSAEQRFFGQILISMSMPSVLDAMERDLAAGRSPVVQLVNTLEAAQERALAAEGAMENLEDLDLTPRDILAQYVDLSFPTRAYEDYVDEEGRTRTRPVVDCNGAPVHSAQALKLRADLQDEIARIKVPLGPLEMILDRFGVENVAELTGRSRRVVYKPDPRTGEIVRMIETRGPTAMKADLKAFWDDAKRVAVFSGAANEGIDLHAGRTFKNQRQRRHYLLQAGFNAKAADQGRGRTKRTDSVSEPEYILVTSNIQAQMRFTSTIARRLAALGAMTKGQSDTGASGLFSERDNLENEYGQAAVEQIVREIVLGGSVAGFDMADFEAKLGLKVTDHDGNLVHSKMPPVKRFLNRLLSLRVAEGNAMFMEFDDRRQEIIQAAIDVGTYNQGVETYRADRVERVSEPQVVYREPTSGAETYYVHLKAWHRRVARSFVAVAEGCHFGGRRRAVEGWVREIATNRVHAVALARHRMDGAGTLIEQVRLVGPFDEKFEDRRELSSSTGRYESLTVSKAKRLWEAESTGANEWAVRDLHLVCGVLLPVWERIRGTCKVYRVVDEDGGAYLGRLIAPHALRETMRNLGSSLTTAWTPAEVEETVLAGQPVTLANGWTLRRSKVNRDWRVELTGVNLTAIAGLKAMGLFTEIVAYVTRLFVPVGNADAMAKLLTRHPAVDGAPFMKAAA